MKLEYEMTTGFCDMCGKDTPHKRIRTGTTASDFYGKPVSSTRELVKYVCQEERDEAVCEEETECWEQW